MIVNPSFVLHLVHFWTFVDYFFLISTFFFSQHLDNSFGNHFIPHSSNSHLIWEEWILTGKTHLSNTILLRRTGQSLLTQCITFSLFVLISSALGMWSELDKLVWCPELLFEKEKIVVSQDGLGCPCAVWCCCSYFASMRQSSLRMTQTQGVGKRWKKWRKA